MQSGTEYGDLLPLVKAAGWLISAAWALIFGWRGRSKRWAPSEEEIPGAPSRIAGLLTAVLLGVLWFQETSDITQGRWLLPILWVSVAVTVVAFLLNNFALTTLMYERVEAQHNQPVTTRIVGGLWLTPEAREVRRKVHDTIQNIFAGNEYVTDRVWPRPARAFAKVLFIIFYLLFTVGGSAALAAGALVTLAAQEPRILEFSIAPSEIGAGEAATMRWRVTNAKATKIDPLGQVAGEGRQQIQPQKATVYTLTAENSYASRGVQLGVTVRPVAARSKPKQVVKSQQVTGTPPPFEQRATVMQARDCRLVRAVVVRGDGWLQGETDAEGLQIAACDVNLARGGRYELFVRYASGESRPVRVTLNNIILQESALAAATGGWSDPNSLDQTLGVVMARSGTNVLEFYTEHQFPHIQRVWFTPLP